MTLPKPRTHFRAVYDAIVRRDGLYFTSSALAAEVGISPSYVRRAVHQLKGRGLIDVESKRADHGWTIARVRKCA